MKLNDLTSYAGDQRMCPNDNNDMPPAEQIAELKREVVSLKAQLLEKGGEKSSSATSVENALEASRIRQDEVEALLEGAKALLIQGSFETAARGLFDACKAITGATAGYVALLSDDGSENEVLFLDAGGRECTVDPHLPMPIRGLRAESYRASKAVCDNAFHNSKWWGYLPEGHVFMDNVMFAPLIIDEKPVGLIGLANKDGGFTQRDLEMATVFGDMASVALRERRSEEKRRELTESLQKALKEVRQLSGIIPICANCKKIRDDEGYWQRVESYIQEHSDAHFSHGICPECRKELYPGL